MKRSTQGRFLRSAFLIGLAAHAVANPNYWKHCDATEPTSCQGVTVPSSWDPSNFVATSTATWLPTCCKLDTNPALSQFGFYCFSDSRAPLTCPASQLGIQGTGDPLMTGFDRRTFMFDGEVGHFYNILSEQTTQISGHFTAAHMYDHNGTYITTMGVKSKEFKIKVHVVHDGSLEVYIDNKPLEMAAGKWTKQVELMPAGAQSAAEATNVTWQYYRKEYGHTVEVSTPLMTLLIWSTPPQPDAGGVMQPSYLNFKTSLRTTPEGEMHGILGQSYEQALVAAMAGTAAGDSKDEEGPAPTIAVTDFEGRAADYELPHLFSDDFQYNRFAGMEASGGEAAVALQGSSRRLLGIGAERPGAKIAEAQAARVQKDAAHSARRRKLADEGAALLTFPLHAQAWRS